MTNEYDGIQHDYTRKHGLAWQQVLLPEAAPSAWKDRAVLWNAVEDTEKSKDSRLAREIILALPRELDNVAWIQLMTEYIHANFMPEGMCADVSIHNADEKNPHAHILLTVRPLNADGTWQHKTEKEYLCVKGNEERGFTAAEFQAAQANGWEKQYPYLVNGKMKYMAPSHAQSHGYKRTSKYPKSTKFGRQNPISERWNSDEQLVTWRATWAEIVNTYLERAGVEERIDHRSHAERGLTEQPTIHEGVEARILEKMGFVSDRCEINRQIRADNALLRELRSAYSKLVQAVKATLPAIAEALEKVRQKLFIVSYQLRHIRKGKTELTKTLDTVLPDFKRYTTIIQKLKAASKQRKQLLAEKEATPIYQVAKRIEQSRRITTLTEEIEELRSEKTRLLHTFDKTDDVGMQEVKKRVAEKETSLGKLEQSESKYSVELENTLTEYRELTAQAATLDANALAIEREALRPDIMQEVKTRLRKAYGQRYDYDLAQQAEKDVAMLLGEKPEKKLSIHQQLSEAREHQPVQTRKPKQHTSER